MPLLDLTEVRPRAAAALAPADDADPDVHVDVVDALFPPCLMLDWGNPWLVPATVAGGLGQWEARLVVWAIAGRVEPGPGIETLEQLVCFTIGRLQVDGYAWPTVASVAPYRYDFGGVPYLAARLEFRVSVAVEGRVAVPLLSERGGSL